MDLDSGVNGAYHTSLPSSQEHRNMCPGPLVVAHTRPTKSSQPHRVQEWLSKSKPKVPVQMQHWQIGCHLSWCSIHIQSETSIWHCVLRENTRIWDVHVQQPGLGNTWLPRTQIPQEWRFEPTFQRWATKTCWRDSCIWRKFRMVRRGEGGWVPDMALESNYSDRSLACPEDKFHLPLLRVSSGRGPLALWKTYSQTWVEK